MTEPTQDTMATSSEDVSLLLSFTNSQALPQTTGPPIPSDPNPASSAPRKRATKACLVCRARKVKCDVTVTGLPCSKCRLDSEECNVVERPSKYRKRAKGEKDEVSRASKSAPPTQYHTSTGYGDTPAPRSPRALNGNGGENMSMNKPLATEYDNRDHEQYTSRFEPPVHGFGQATTGINTPGYTDSSSPADRPLNDSRHFEQRLVGEDISHAVLFLNQRPWVKQQPMIDPELSQSFTAPLSRSNLFKPLVPQSLGQQGSLRLSQDGCVPYSQYHFIKPDDLSHVEAEDIDFLKARGAFQLPGMPALEEFMQEYFKHVHPHLPMIDEGLFWDGFYRNDTESSQKYQISLFTFQAMLFACSNFVSLYTLRGVGFESIRQARATLYRRAKLLFDLDGKRDRIFTAQGALLLTYSPDTHNRKVNTYWLVVGINYAKDAGAHRYNTSTGLSPEQKNNRKRLWWCCILRDRILPLGVRRPLNITPQHFDFNCNPPLTVEDLASETDKSRVYDPSTKRSLAELVAVLCELAVILTDIIMIVYPLDETPIDNATEVVLYRVKGRTERSKAILAQWHDSASVRFPTPAGLGDSNESLTLFTDLMYIYYHSAKTALCHHEVLLSEMVPSPDSGSQTQLQRSKKELQESVVEMTEIMKELLNLKLLQYMPLSIVAYAAHPLILHALDVKLSSTKSECSNRQRRLQIFMETMNILHAQYDGTDRVSAYIEKIIHYLARPSLPNSHDSNAAISSPSSNATSDSHSPVLNDWSDVFLHRTTCYLRIVTAIDLSFSMGEFPEESNFPAILHSSKLSAILPLYRMDMNAIQTNHPPTNARNKRALVDKHETIGESRKRHAGTVLYGTSPTYSTASATPIHMGGPYFDSSARMGYERALSGPSPGGLGFMGQSGNANEQTDLGPWIFDVLPLFS